MKAEWYSVLVPHGGEHVATGRFTTRELARAWAASLPPGAGAAGVIRCISTNKLRTETGGRVESASAVGFTEMHRRRR